MKKISSIKTRITIWYTTLMFILVVVILLMVGFLSYQLSIDNIGNNLRAQVLQVSEKIKTRRSDEIFYAIESNEEFKNVSIYRNNGEYVVGKYVYDISNIPFVDGQFRRETVDGKEYIVYDVFKWFGQKEHGFWIRGAEYIQSTMILGRYAFIIVVIAIPIVLLFAAFGGYYITKKAFLPINKIIMTANDIYLENDIQKRIPINPKAQNDELKSLSLALNKMLDKIENLIMQEKQFTSDASHELRTPISVILAQGEYLLDITENDKERELAENIVSKAKQISTLIARLLLLARIDSNRQKINKEKIDVGVIIDVAVEQTRALANEKDITISVNVDDDTYIYADEALILSAITNLISNAIKYGRQSGYVHIEASHEADKIKITVKDNGVGLSAEHIDKIWVRFYKVDDVRNDEFGSCGLGLSMVKSIVELHGGKIYVKSELDKGSEFVMLLKN